MCMGATCPLCSKRAWRGCGSHIPSAMSSAPEEQWCTCSPRVSVGGKEYPPAAGSGQKTEGGKDGKDEL